MAFTVLALLLALAASVFAYRLRFGDFPPSRVNLLYWIDANDPECYRSQRVVAAEGAPLIGTDVRIADICAYVAG